MRRPEWYTEPVATGALFWASTGARGAGVVAFAPVVTVEGTLRSLRRRAWTVLAIRASVAASGGLAAALAAAGLVLGPLAGSPALVVAWCLAIAAAASAALWALEGLGDVRGAEVTRLYGAVDPRLVSRVRTASSLERSGLGAAALRPPALGSAELARAHVAATARALAAIPLERVLPWRTIAHPAALVAVLGGALGALVLVASPRAAGGLFALLHPAAREVEGAARAALFAEVDARVVFPAYQGREALEVRGFGVLTVPVGATVEVRARSRVPLAAAEATLGTSTAPFEADPSGAWVARFVVREGAPLSLRGRTEEGGWRIDAAAREIRALTDAPPIVSLAEPSTDLTVELEDELVFDARAGDDVGLTEVALVIETADGRSIRRRLEGLAPGAREHAGRITLRIAELAPQPGDRIHAHIEALDGDEVSGPNVGRSVTRTLTLANYATKPLQCGLTYTVRVRVSFDGGATWCAWGNTCTISTEACPPVAGGGQRDLVATSGGDLTVWPNPNRGEQLFVAIDDLGGSYEHVSLDITDMFGKRVVASTIPVQGTNLNTVMDLNDLASGMYLVTVTTGDRAFVQRLVIQ